MLVVKWWQLFDEDDEGVRHFEGSSGGVTVVNGYSRCQSSCRMHVMNYQ